MHEKTLSRKTVYEGRILSVDVLEVELENGKTSVREIVQHGVAVALIPQLPDGRFVFIRQFRKPMERICFEVVAGNCDPGEPEEVSAARELQEETGFLVDVVGAPVHLRRTRFEFEGSTYDQEEHFFVAAVEVLQLDDSGWTDVERRVIVEHRWWALAELRTTGQTVYPEELADLLTELLTGR